MAASFLSTLTSLLFTPTALLLIVGGFLVGIFSVVTGGGFFFSIPLFQWQFPALSYGTIVGNLKVGSFFRGIGSTWETWKEIHLMKAFKASIPLIFGVIIGVLLIAQIDQRWILPALVVAILLSEFADKLAKMVTPSMYLGASFLTGVYSGILGAGVGVILVAILRLKDPEDFKIADLKMQTRFLEWIMGIVAVIAHLAVGNLLLWLLVPWSVGSVVGGIVGAKVLRKVGTMSGGVQKLLLRTAYCLALLAAIAPFLK